MEQLRQLLVEKIQADPDGYTEALLGIPVQLYLRRILNKDRWGGYIEISILAKHFGVEIVVFNSVNSSIQVVSSPPLPPESRRCCLLYDGAHYDLFVLTELPYDVMEAHPAAETLSEDVALFLRADGGFVCAEFVPQMMARSLSLQESEGRPITFRCETCNAVLIGVGASRDHSLNTGHLYFETLESNS